MEVPDRRLPDANFADLALPLFDQLFNFANWLTQDRHEAEDLVQETYLQAWKSFHRFTPGTNCRAWLFKILFHVIHHHRRKCSHYGCAERARMRWKTS